MNDEQLDPRGTAIVGKTGHKYQSITRGTRRPAAVSAPLPAPKNQIVQSQTVQPKLDARGLTLIPLAPLYERKTKSPVPQSFIKMQNSIPTDEKSLYDANIFVGEDKRFGKFYFRRVEQRHQFYTDFDAAFARCHGIYFFKIAAMTTDNDGIGRVDLYNFYYLHDNTEDFLRKANAYLSVNNVDNFAFNIRANKPIPGTGGLKGRALDYRMVEIEQETVYKFIQVYKDDIYDNPEKFENWRSIVKEVNNLLGDESTLDLIEEPYHRAAYKYAFSECRKERGSNFRFDFFKYSDRVLFGKKLIDFVYSN